MKEIIFRFKIASLKYVILREGSDSIEKKKDFHIFFIYLEVVKFESFCRCVYTFESERWLKIC